MDWWFILFNVKRQANGLKMANAKNIIGQKKLNRKKNPEFRRQRGDLRGRYTQIESTSKYAKDESKRRKDTEKNHLLEQQRSKASY